ncbi:MAG: hypothetical protein V2B15_02900 [Bacteroidota bacterium]
MKKIFPTVLAIVLLMALATGVFGQMNYRKGRIITLNNDTIEGLVRDIGMLQSSKECLFKENRKAKPLAYLPGDLMGYELSGYKHYASKEWIRDGGYSRLFAEVLIRGDLSLYHNWRNKSLAYYLENDSGIQTGLQNVEFNLRRRSENGYYATYGDQVQGFIPVYRDSLRSVFRDSENTYSQVEQVEYRMKPIMEITKSYLGETCEGEECITYEKNLRLTRDRFGIFAGVQLTQMFYSKSMVESLITPSYPVGIFYQIPLSLVSERISFQAEVLYRHLNYDPLCNLPIGHTERTLQTDVVGIPLLFHYRMSVHRFSPTLGLGNELGFVLGSDVRYNYIDEEGEPVEDRYFVHSINKGGWFLDVGLDFDLSRDISLFTKLRIQSYRSKIIDNKVENNVTFKVAEGEEYFTYAAALYVGLKF